MCRLWRPLLLFLPALSLLFSFLFFPPLLLFSPSVVLLLYPLLFKTHNVSTPFQEATLRDGGSGATHAYRACERRCRGDGFFARCRDDCFAEFYKDRGLKPSNIVTWTHDDAWKMSMDGGMTESMGGGSFGGGDNIA